MSAPSLAERLTRQSGSSFYYAFRLLPDDKRRAIYALYSFCRVVDDCVDEPDGEGEAGLARWWDEFQRCYAGQPQTELGRELAEAVNTFPIPRACFEDIVHGCRMDLTTTRYETYDDLLVYSRRVASAVGLASIEIFGYRDPRTRDYAIELGLALQLTNILRDVGQDAQRDRLYLPLADLARFDLDPKQFMAAALGQALRPARASELMAFEGERARAHFAKAAAALAPSERRAMLSAEVMGAVYRELLELLARRDYPLTLARLRLSTARRIWIVLRTLARVYTSGGK
jgi:15-cis-phytoene synthase